MKTHDTEKIEKKLATMQRSEVEVYLKSLIYETEKRLIEVQSNSFGHLKDRTQNDYNKYLTALEDDDLIYWYDDKVEINGKKLNDTIAQKKGIENHKLLRRRLKIENEIERLQNRKELFKNLFENFEPKSESEFLITKVERTRLIEIHTYLSGKYIDVDVDSWLYWFSKQTWTNKKEKPKRIKWIGAVYHLTNVVYLICGNMNIQTETAMKKAFELPKGAKFQSLTVKNIKGDFYTDLKNMIVWAERYAIK
jgi:hypothetical protein